MSVPIPKGVNWFIWRVATHEDSKASLDEIETRWSLSQLVEAHMALNVRDELKLEVAREQRRRLEKT